MNKKYWASNSLILLSYALTCLFVQCAHIKFSIRHTFCIFFNGSSLLFTHESFGWDYKIAEKKSNTVNITEKKLLCINSVGVFFCRSTFISVSVSFIRTFQLFRTYMHELINKYSLLVPIYIKCKHWTHINMHSHHWAGWLECTINKNWSQWTNQHTHSHTYNSE